MMNVKPKSLAFWVAMFSVAACVTFNLTNGAIAFSVLALAIWLLG